MSDWEAINLRHRVGFDYLGQIWEVYQTGGAVWRGVLTHFPDDADEPYFSVLDSEFETSEEAQRAIDAAIIQHQSEQGVTQ